MNSNLSGSERGWAAAAHFSGIPFPILGPIAVFLFGPRSRFVRFHAAHAIVGTVMLNLFLFVLGAISISMSVYNLYRNWQEGFEHFSWWTLILKSAVTWVIFALIGLANTIMNVAQGAVAFRGEIPSGMTTRLLKRSMKLQTIASPELA